MAARLVVLSICVLGLNSLPVQASDSVETGVSLRSSEVSAVVIGGPQLTVEPWVSPRVARRNQRKITIMRSGWETPLSMQPRKSCMPNSNEPKKKFLY